MSGLQDPVALVVATLNAAGLAAHGRPPVPRPAEFVTAHRVGGMRMNQALEHARVAVTFWAETGARAAQLAVAGRTALGGMTALDGVNRVAEALVFDVPDPETGLPRVRVDIDLHLTAN